MLSTIARVIRYGTQLVLTHIAKERCWYYQKDHPTWKP